MHVYQNQDSPITAKIAGAVHAAHARDSALRLNKTAELFDSGRLVTDVGTVLPLEQARTAHEMLGGAPHKRGKIVLRIAA